MAHDPLLLERLSGFPTAAFEGEVYRATRRSLDPLAPSTRGGRWARPNGPSVLYTSLERDGALAEIAFHWSQLTPIPTKPARVHRMRVRAGKTLRLVEADLAALGVDFGAYGAVNYSRTQEIGSAVAWLGRDGLRVPSARWDCENMVLFTSNQGSDVALDLLVSEEIDWRAWAQAHGFLSDTSR